MSTTPRKISTAAVLVLSALLRAQSPSFDVASIRPSKSGSASSSGIKTAHGQLNAQNVTLQRCVIGAYGVGPNQIVGAPDWFNSDRFDIAAKGDPSIDDDGQIMLMLQSLLAERFKLTLHREMKTMSAYVLEVGKNGPKLEKADGGEAATDSSGNRSGLTIRARNTNMDLLARVLARNMDLPVVNQTHLDGAYNFNLHWTRDTVRPIEGEEELSIFTAIQEQLGLHLRAQKAPVEVLVIDHVERTPTEN